MIVVVMGVSCSGKTTVGELLAKRSGAELRASDYYHPLANKQKMAAGHPLNDADRQPWLEELNRLLGRWLAAGTSGVVGCSALKASYRATLESGLPHAAVTFVLLDGSNELIAQLLAKRKHEYINTKL